MGNFIKKALLGSAIFTAGAAFGVVAAIAYKKTMEELENLDMVDYEEDEEEGPAPDSEKKAETTIQEADAKKFEEAFQKDTTNTEN